MIVWSIDKLNCYPEFAGKQNVVCSIEWKASLTQNNHVSVVSGIYCINRPNSSSLPNFIEYEDLTETIVVDWLKSRLPIEEIEQELEEKLNRLENPPIISPPLPW